MVHAGETTKEFELKCEGYEGTAKGKIFHRACWNLYRVRINIRYKDRAAEGKMHNQNHAAFNDTA
jgi:hypothetical protein